MFAFDSVELATEAVAAAGELSVHVDARVTSDVAAWAREVTSQLGPQRVVLGAAYAQPPAPAELIDLANALREVATPFLFLSLGRGPLHDLARAVADDLGWVVVARTSVFASAVSMVAAYPPHEADPASQPQPWLAVTKDMSELDRERIAHARPARKGSRARAETHVHGRLVRLDAQRLGWQLQGSSPIAVGACEDVAQALCALHRASTMSRKSVAGPRSEAESSVEAARAQQRRAVHEIIFGPKRALSDPSSKMVLRAYDVPVPSEELCSSPSRAAAEASRIGFPIRIALASPDIRVWDHPELMVEPVQHATQVREVFSQLMTLAHTLNPNARVLGASIAPAAVQHARWRVVVRAVASDWALAHVEFADPHGAASHDGTHVLLPRTVELIDRSLMRLAGHSLLDETPHAARPPADSSLSDTLLRLGQLTVDHQDSIEQIEINPLVLTRGGSMEIQQACVTVSQAFERAIEEQL
jgi:hypothetical protein